MTAAVQLATEIQVQAVSCAGSFKSLSHPNMIYLLARTCGWSTAAQEKWSVPQQGSSQHARSCGRTREEAFGRPFPLRYSGRDLTLLNSAIDERNRAREERRTDLSAQDWHTDWHNPQLAQHQTHEHL